MKLGLLIFSVSLSWNIIFASSVFAKSSKTNKCIVAVELNDLDFNRGNRNLVMTVLQEMGFEPKEFFIDNKDQLSSASRTISAVHFLDYGPRPGINEDAPYVNQSQISLIVPKSTVVDLGNPSKLVYNIQVFALKNVKWTVTTDDLQNKQAHFRGEVEKVSSPIEIGQRLSLTAEKMPPICDLVGKGKMDVINPEICSLQKSTESLTDKDILKKQMSSYLKNCN